MKSVKILGGSLAAALLASELVKREYEVLFFAPEANSIVRGWEHVELGGVNVDNGFHAIDVHRAPRLSHFLCVELGAPFMLDQRDLGLLLDSRLGGSTQIGPSDFESLDGTDSAEKVELTEMTVGTAEHLVSSLEKHRADLFKNLAVRYGDEWEDTRHFFIPWFLPHNHLLDSHDEGDQIRNLMRLAVLDQRRISPSGGPFSQWGALWKEWLQGHDNFHLEETNPPNLSTSASVKSGRNFRLTLLEAHNSRAQEFAEILLAEPKLPAIGRVSSLEKIGDGLLLAESFHADGAPVNVAAWEPVFEDLFESPAKVLDSKVTRKLARAGGYRRPAIEISGSESTPEVRFDSGGPVNMAKAEPLVVEALRSLEIA